MSCDGSCSALSVWCDVPVFGTPLLYLTEGLQTAIPVCRILPPPLPPSALQLVPRAVGGPQAKQNQTTSFPRNFYPHLFIGVRGNKNHQPGVIRKRESVKEVLRWGSVNPRHRAQR